MAAVDIRRFVASGYGGMSEPMILANNGSYRTINSLFNTLQETYGNISYNVLKTNCLGLNVVVRDNFSISGFIFNFPVQINFRGSGTFTANSGSAFVSFNASFEDLKFDIGYKKGIVIGSDVKFNNCSFNYTFNAAGDGGYDASRPCNPLNACIYTDPVLDGFSNKYNISIKNCVFTSNQADRYPFISFLMNNASNYYQNFDISNNYFDYSGGVSDSKAAICFGQTSTDSVNIFEGSRLVNCKIENNICQQDQMIVLSATPNGSNKMMDALVPINVSVSKNTCGAICFFTRDGGLITNDTSNKTFNQENCIRIKDNTVKYIFSGTIYGLINVVGSSNRIIYDIVTSSEIFSSSVMIQNNICSWIHIGVKNPSTTVSLTRKRPFTLIDGNQITSAPSILTTYWSSITPLNMGLLIDSVEGN